MDFYLSKNGQQTGPFRIFQVKEMVEHGEAAETDLGWHQGLDAWKPLTEIDAIAPYLPSATPPPLPPALADGTPAGEMPEPSTGWPGHAAAREARRHGTEGAEMTKMELFVRQALPRFLARSLDSMLFFGLVCLIGGAAGLLPAAIFPFPPTWLMPAQSFAAIVVEAWLLSRYGATPGKWLFSIRVEDEDGLPPTFFQALKRGLFLWLCAWGLGFDNLALFGSAVALILYLQNGGRTVWDHVLRTRVVHAPVVPWAWAVFAAFLAVYAAIKMILFLTQPLPGWLPAQTRELFERQKTLWRETYRQNGITPSKPD